MRLLQLRPIGLPLSLSDIENFQRLVGIQFPKSYHEFLLRYNGGVSIAGTSLEYTWQKDTAVDISFYAAETTPDRGVWRAINELSELSGFTSEYIPFAGDTSQRDYCFHKSRDNEGIYIADYIYEGDLPIAVRMIQVEESFTKFLKQLQEYIFPKDDIQELGELGTKKDLEIHLGNGRCIDELSMYGSSLLCEAIKNDNVELVKECLSLGANLKRTIYTAVQCRRADMLELLVEAGADINELEGRKTPLHYARGLNHREVRKILVRLGAI